MSREEEIIEAGIEYTMRTKPRILAGDKFFEEMREFNRNKAFEEGAKWADKTMIDKACKWLLNIDFDGQEFRDCDELFNNDLFVNAFRKAMEK
jgi:hypothetical protein